MLTNRQREVLRYLREYQEVKGYSPTYREIGRHFAIAPKNARECILVLAREGVLSCEEGTARSIVLGNKRYAHTDAEPLIE